MRRSTLRRFAPLPHLAPPIGSLPALPLIAGTLLTLGACSNPLATEEADRGERVPIDRLRRVERFDSGKYVRPNDPPPDPKSVPRAVSDRFAGAESVKLTLEEVRAAALENNLDLKVALVDPTISSQGLREEEAKFEAVFRPTAAYRENDQPTFDVTNANNQDSGFIGAGVDIPLRTGGRVSVDLSESLSQTANPFFTFNTAYNADLAFSISHPLLRGAGRRANTYSIRIASYNDQITQARTKLEVIRQLANADRAYWRLDAARRNLEVTQQQYELAQTQLERAQRRVRAGDVADIEILRAEAGLAERLGAIIIAENLLLDRQRDLKRLVNVPGLGIETETMVVPGTPPDPVRYRFDGAELTDHAQANRMEMLELELQLAADFSTIEFNKNQALPLIALDYNYNIGGLGQHFRDANEQLWANDFESWSIQLSGSVPIGNEAAKARVQQAILRRLQRLSTKDARRLAIQQEVLTAVDQIEADWQRIMAARQSTIANTRAFEAEKRQFDAGGSTSTDVLDAASRLAQAQFSEIQSITDYQVSLVDLAFASGTLLGATKIDWEPLDPSGEPGADPTGPAFPFPHGPDQPSLGATHEPAVPAAAPSPPPGTGAGSGQ